MGWTCQHDHQGYCKLIKKECVPGMKGCILKSDFVFSGVPETKKDDDKKESEEIDYAALARSH